MIILMARSKEVKLQTLDRKLNISLDEYFGNRIGLKTTRTSQRAPGPTLLKSALTTVYLACFNTVRRVKRTVLESSTTRILGILISH